MQNQQSFPQQHEELPQQRSIMDEAVEEKKPSVIGTFLKRVGLGVLLALAVVLAYLFLLLGEPDEDAKYVAQQPEAVIAMPMSPLEVPGQSNLQSLADTFCQPIMALYQGLEMRKARIFDTAFEGGYARRVTLTYVFEDGEPLIVESLRPTSAVTLISGNGYSLDGNTLYSIGGLNAARMDNAQQSCVFAQSANAVYAIFCPKSHIKELNALLKQTTLVAPEQAQ